MKTAYEILVTDNPTLLLNLYTAVDNTQEFTPLFVQGGIGAYVNAFCGNMPAMDMFDGMAVQMIAAYILGAYAQRWTGLLNALRQEYDPIQNYDNTEIITNYHSVTKNNARVSGAAGNTSELGKQLGSITVDDSGNITTTLNTGTVVRQTNKSTTFDSETENETGISEQTGSTGTVSQNITKTHTETETIGVTVGADDTAINTAIDAASVDGHKLRRYGNIGVTTSQQMLESEINLRAAHQFIPVFIRDCVNAVASGVWS